MANVGSFERSLRDTSNGEHTAPAPELPRERQCRFDLGACWRAVRPCRARVRRHHVPEEDVVLEVQLGKYAVHDRRGCLSRTAAGELALGGERDAGDARAAVAGGFADEEQRCVRALIEVARKALRQALVAILVERVADPRSGEALYQ